MYKKRVGYPKYVDYDLIVLGSGAGGGVAAHIAAKAGKRVAVVEPEKIGGECPNYGCVPTKALLQAAETYTTARDGEQFGVRARDISVQYPAIRAWKNKAVAHTGTEEGEHVYANDGIKLLHGKAHFLDKWTVSVNGHRYKARNFLIATGTKSVVPPIPGLAETGFITYREAIDYAKPPKSLFVIGGGAIGCEFSHFFNTFGVKIHIADIAPRLIPLEDPEVGELVGALFEQRGISLHLNAKIVRISKKGVYKIVQFEVNGAMQQVAVEEILLSSGKAPNTDLGLENAGVMYDRRGIKVNEYMQTANKHIYAAGDVTGPYCFTHTASYQSRVAAHNMFHRKRKVKTDYHAVPRCVFIEPEVACVGATESQLKEQGIVFRVGAVPISIIGRANTTGVSTGFVKVLASKNGTLLGASIVSPRAGEMLHELTLAIQHNMKARDISNTIHAFPTWSEAVRNACNKLT